MKIVDMYGQVHEMKWWRFQSIEVDEKFDDGERDIWNKNWLHDEAGNHYEMTISGILKDGSEMTVNCMEYIDNTRSASLIINGAKYYFKSYTVSENKNNL